MQGARGRVAAKGLTGLPRPEGEVVMEAEPQVAEFLGPVRDLDAPDDGFEVDVDIGLDPRLEAERFRREGEVHDGSVAAVGEAPFESVREPVDRSIREEPDARRAPEELMLGG